jgi:hypothetical protein
VKTTKDTKITETSVASVATDKNTGKNDKTTAKPDLSTDQVSKNRGMVLYLMLTYLRQTFLRKYNNLINVK